MVLQFHGQLSDAVRSLRRSFLVGRTLHQQDGLHLLGDLRCSPLTSRLLSRK